MRFEKAESKGTLIFTNRTLMKAGEVDSMSAAISGEWRMKDYSCRLVTGSKPVLADEATSL